MGIRTVTRQKKLFRYTTILFALFFFPVLQLSGSENDKHKGSPSRLEVISKAKTAVMSKNEISKIELEESKKHTVDGYLAHSKVVDCFDALAYQYTGGRYNDKQIRFRLRCPPTIKPGKTYPLVVWFHGTGESDDDNERQLAHLQSILPHLTGPESLDFFMLVTQCPKDNRSWMTSLSHEGKGDAPFTVAMEIFEQILEEYPIDRNRISTFGQCSGAAASTALIRKYPGLIAAVVYISASPPEGLPITDVAISAFNCTGDPMVSIQPMRNYIKRIKKAGGNAALTEIQIASHDAWSPALSTYRVIAWMIQQNKNSILSPPPGVVFGTRTWIQSFIYFGLPICCMIPFLLIRLRKKK
jgi:predicted peptidase